MQINHDAIAYAIPPLLSSLFALALSIFVYLRGPQSPVNRTFSAFMLSCTVWLVGFSFMNIMKVESDAFVFSRILYSAVVFIPTFYYHFILTLVSAKRGILLRLCYLASTVFLIILWSGRLFLSGNILYSWGYSSRASIAHHIFLVFFFLLMLSSLAQLFKRLKSSWLSDRAEANKMRYVILAHFVAMLASTDFLSTYGIDYYPLGFLFMIAFSLITSYTIVKHQLMDIKIAFRRTLIYSVWLLLVTVPYIGLVLLTHAIASNGFHSLKALSFFAVSSLLCGLLSITLSFFALFFGRSKPQRLLGFFNFMVAVWGLGCFIIASSSSKSKTMLGLAFLVSSGTFIGPLFFHLTSLLRKKGPKIPLLIIGYAQALFFGFVSSIRVELLAADSRRIYSFQAIEASPLLSIAVFFFYAYVILGFFNLLAARRNLMGDERKQIDYLLLGFFPGFLGGASLVPSLLYAKEAIYPVGNGGVCLYVLILTYAIFKHGLLDIRVAIKKTFIYAILVSLISVIYLAVVFAFHVFLGPPGNSVGFSSMSVVSIFLIAIMFKPVELFFTRRVEKRFFQGTIGQIAEQKEKLESELGRRERLKSVGILAAGMAHEIKNPLTSIKTFAEYLPQKYDDPNFRAKFSRIVTDEVDRVNNILKQLLEFSKPAPLDLRPFPIAEILEETITLLSNNLLKNGVELGKQLDAKAMVLGDKNQLKQVLLNLLLNAIQSMPVGGRLSVEVVRMSGGRIRLSISDTGSGMTPEQIQHAFDPFFTTKEAGTGLGLAIAHGIIAKHDGRIEIQSEVGKGTTVNVFLKSPD